MYKAPKSALFAASAAFLALGLSACESNTAARERNPAPCPNILVLNDASRFVDFNGDASLENVAFSGEITDVSLSCRYFEDRPITGALDLTIALGRGPAAEATTKDVTYFVAVTRRNREVIAREEFTVRADFRGDKSVLRLKEKIDRFVIPRASDKTSGVNFEVIVGFALDREQAIYNRSGKSLKFPNL